jgi:hypothetical protein
MPISPSPVLRAGDRARRHFVMERVTWRRAGLISGRDLLALGFGLADVDLLGPPIFAGPTRLCSLAAVDARRGATLGEAAK